jgi:hypothetical protein
MKNVIRKTHNVKCSRQEKIKKKRKNLKMYAAVLKWKWSMEKVKWNLKNAECEMQNLGCGICKLENGQYAQYSTKIKKYKM